MATTLYEFEYDIMVTIPGPPRRQERHRHQVRARSGTGVEVRTSRGEETLYRLKDVYAQAYDPSKSDKQQIRLLAMCNAPLSPLDCPLRVDVVLYYEYLKGHFGTGRNANKLKPSAPMYKATMPDRDNADKIILDALQGLYWKNDSCVADGRIIKLYSRTPRTEVYITKLDPKGDRANQSLFSKEQEDG